MAYQRRQSADQIGKLMLRLLPHGWKIRVWENLGWHVEAYRGILSVTPARESDDRMGLTDYCASIAAEPGEKHTGARGHLSLPIRYASTPRGAIAAVIRTFRTMIAAERARLDRLVAAVAAVDPDATPAAGRTRRRPTPCTG